MLSREGVDHLQERAGKDVGLQQRGKFRGGEASDIELNPFQGLADFMGCAPSGFGDPLNAIPGVVFQQKTKHEQHKQIQKCFEIGLQMSYRLVINAFDLKFNW